MKYLIVKSIFLICIFMLLSLNINAELPNTVTKNNTKESFIGVTGETTYAYPQEEIGFTIGGEAGFDKPEKSNFFLQYIIKNKEWLFSGVGVAIILGIIGLFSKWGKTHPNNNSNNNTHADTKKSMELLTEYMKINYNQTISKFEEDMNIIAKVMNAQGELKSGAHYKEGVKCLINNVQSYTNNSIQYMKNLKQTMPLDKTKISELVTNYQNTDLSYYINFMKNHFQYLEVNDLTTKINNIYTLAQLQISAI